MIWTSNLEDFPLIFRKIKIQIWSRSADGACFENIHYPSYSNLNIFQTQMLTNKSKQSHYTFYHSQLNLYDTQNVLQNPTDQIEKAWNDPFSKLCLI